MKFLAKAYDAHPRLTTGAYFLLMCAISIGTGVASYNADTVAMQNALMCVAVPTMFVAFMALIVFWLELIYAES